MSIVFEQFFYGRGARGYTILGVSPGGTGLASRVEELCGAVGTPSGDYGGEPFLMSVPDGGRVIMVCGRRGTPDSMGRATLFFHVLVAEKDALSAAKADAFSLFEQGAFAEKMPAGDVTTLNFDVSDVTSGTGVHLQYGKDKLDVTLPCIFRSEKPAAKLVHNAIGKRANELSWATFSFQSLPDFDVQVFPPRVQGIRTVNEYDASGRLVCSAAVANAPRAEERLDGGREYKPQTHYSNVSNVPIPEKSNAMLKFSIIVNLILVIVCAMLWMSRKSISSLPASQTKQIVVTNYFERVVEKPIVMPLSDEQKASIEMVAIERYRSELKETFPGKSKEAFLKFSEKATKFFGKYYGDDYDKETEANKTQFKSEHDFLDELGNGIDFVNINLLKGKTE